MKWLFERSFKMKTNIMVRKLLFLAVLLVSLCGFFCGSAFSQTPGATCDSPTAAALPLAIDGAGEFCRVTSGDIGNINSWNTQLVEINGEDFTNTWSNRMPEKIDGNYTIHSGSR